MKCVWRTACSFPLPNRDEVCDTQTLTSGGLRNTAVLALLVTLANLITLVSNDGITSGELSNIASITSGELSNIAGAATLVTLVTLCGLISDDLSSDLSSELRNIAGLPRIP